MKTQIKHVRLDRPKFWVFWLCTQADGSHTWQGSWLNLLDSNPVGWSSVLAWSVVQSLHCGLSSCKITKESEVYGDNTENQTLKNLNWTSVDPSSLHLLWPPRPFPPTEPSLCLFHRRLLKKEPWGPILCMVFVRLWRLKSRMRRREIVTTAGRLMSIAGILLEEWTVCIFPCRWSTCSSQTKNRESATLIFMYLSIDNTRVLSTASRFSSIFGPRQFFWTTSPTRRPTEGTNRDTRWVWSRR